MRSPRPKSRKAFGRRANSRTPVHAERRDRTREGILACTSSWRFAFPRSILSGIVETSLRTHSNGLARDFHPLPLLCHTARFFAFLFYASSPPMSSEALPHFRKARLPEALIQGMPYGEKNSHAKMSSDILIRYSTKIVNLSYFHFGR